MLDLAVLHVDEAPGSWRGRGGRPAMGHDERLLPLLIERPDRHEADYQGPELSLGALTAQVLGISRISHELYTCAGSRRRLKLRKSTQRPAGAVPGRLYRRAAGPWRNPRGARPKRSSVHENGVAPDNQPRAPRKDPKRSTVRETGAAPALVRNQLRTRRTPFRV